MMKELKQSIIHYAEMIGTTFGPEGKYVVIHPANQRPYFTRDGVTVAKNLDRSKPAVALLVDACENTVLKAGDGTTTTALLIAALLRSGKNPKGYLDKVIEVVEQSKMPPSLSDLEQVAKSASHDEQIGAMVANIAYQLGESGYIQGKPGEETRAYLQPGYALGSGALIPNFLDPRPNPSITHLKSSIRLDNPLVAIVEEKMESAEPVKKIFASYQQKVYRAGVYTRPLLLVVGDMSEQALQFVMANFQPRTNTPAIPCFVVKSPVAGNRRMDVLEDVKYVTGTGRIYGKYQGLAVKAFDGDFGQADSVEISETECRIIRKEADLQARIAHIKATRDTQDEFTQSRISRLSGAVGVIEFARDIYSAHRNLELQVEDTVMACQKALQEGCIPGGQHIWKKLAETFPDLREEFETIKKRLPSTSTLDSVVTVKSAIESAFSLAAQLANCDFIIGQGLNNK